MSEAIASIHRTATNLGRWFQSAVQDCAVAFARIGEPIEPYVGPPVRFVLYSVQVLFALLVIGFATLIILPFALLGTALGYVKHVAHDTEEGLRSDDH